MLDFSQLGSLEEIEAGNKDFSPLPVGKYEAIVTKVEQTQSKAGLTARKVEFKVVGESFNGRKIWKQFFLESANGLDKTKTMIGMFSGFLKKCGVDQESRSLLLNSGYNPEGLQAVLSDKVYNIVVSQREYEGKTYNEFDGVVSFREAGASF